MTMGIYDTTFSFSLCHHIVQLFEMENIIMHILVQFLFFGYILGKNHFDADVLNNRFKVRRLVKFKMDLCQKIYDVKHSNSDNVEINALNNYAR